MLHDRLTQRVTALAQVLDTSPNELVNRIVEGALEQVDQQKKPRDPIPVVHLARIVLRKNLGLGDRMLQKFLESHIQGWATATQEWRDTILRLSNDVEGELTNATLEKLKRSADRFCSDRQK